MNKKRIVKKVMIKYIIAVIIGGGLGFLYYRMIGCPSGACPITSNPYISTIYGAVMGALVAGIFK